MTRPKRTRTGLKYLSSVRQVLYAPNADLFLLVAAIVVVLAIIPIAPLANSVIRTFFGLLFVLIVPGYALVAALFPGKEDVRNFERAALSIGASIIVAPLIGILLSYSPWGMTLVPFVASISTFGVLCASIARTRRNALAKDERFGVSFEAAQQRVRMLFFLDSTPGLDRKVNAVLILSALLLTSTLVYEAFVPKQGETFTEFYLLGQSGNAADYPTSFQLGQQKSLTVGIVNHEGSDKTYNLAITLQNGTREQLLYAEQVAVANGARWEKNITLTPDMLGTKMKMNFALYLGTDTNTVPYRETHLWVDVKPIS